jgi:hypothetical protein
MIIYAFIKMHILHTLLGICSYVSFVCSTFFIFLGHIIIISTLFSICVPEVSSHIFFFVDIGLSFILFVFMSITIKKLCLSFRLLSDRYEISIVKIHLSLMFLGILIILNNFLEFTSIKPETLINCEEFIYPLFYFITIMAYTRMVIFAYIILSYFIYPFFVKERVYQSLYEKDEDFLGEQKYEKD